MINTTPKNILILALMYFKTNLFLCSMIGSHRLFCKSQFPCLLHLESYYSFLKTSPKSLCKSQFPFFLNIKFYLIFLWNIYFPCTIMKKRLYITLNWTQTNVLKWHQNSSERFMKLGMNFFFLYLLFTQPDL